MIHGLKHFYEDFEDISRPLFWEQFRLTLQSQRHHRVLYDPVYDEVRADFLLRSPVAFKEIVRWKKVMREYCSIKTIKSGFISGYVGHKIVYENRISKSMPYSKLY